MALDIYNDLLPRGWIFWEMEEGRIGGKEAVLFQPIFSTLLQRELRKMQTWSAPDLLTLIGFLLTSKESQCGHSVLLWSGHSCGSHTPAVPGLAVLSLIFSSWREESCLGLWILRLVWLTPLHRPVSPLVLPFSDHLLRCHHHHNICGLCQGLENFLWRHAMCCLVTQSSPTFCSPVGCSPPSSSVHGILQARILEWVAIFSSRGSSWPRDQTRVFCISCIAGRFFPTVPPGKLQTVSILGYSILPLMQENELVYVPVKFHWPK